MVRGLWQHDQCFFIVHKPRGAEKYSILNGNHRFAAMDKFNKAVEADKRFKEFLLRLVLKALEQNGLPLVCGSKNDEDLYRPIMEMYFKHYPEVCTQLLKLPVSTIANLFEIRCSDIPLEQVDVAPDFWKHFLNAAKNNLNGALQLLPSLGEKSAADVIKLMKKLDVDLLAFMSERGPHDYITEEDAIEDLSDGKAVDKKSLLKYFTEIRIDHNKGRDKGTYDWVVIKAKLQSHIKQKALFPNAKFCNTISDASLHEMDLVISQNSTVCFFFGKNGYLLQKGSRYFIR
uniref:Uncharacterized protein n=1 Tax=Panagrolaimus davidi TaxID=227884 RepID=A0A914QZ29_9BILA